MSTIPFGSKVAVWSVLVMVGLPVGTKTPCRTVTVPCVPPMMLVAPPLLNMPPMMLVAPPLLNVPPMVLVAPPLLNMPPMMLVAPPLLNMPPMMLVAPPLLNMPPMMLVAPPLLNVPPDAVVVLPPAVPPDAVVVLPPAVPPTLPPRPDATPPLPLLFPSGARVQAANDTATVIANHPRWCCMHDSLSDHPITWPWPAFFGSRHGGPISDMFPALSLDYKSYGNWT
jgi:hypothetical protein